jgi:hypothetical protein
MNKFPNKANAFIKYVCNTDLSDLRCKGTIKFADMQEKLHFKAIFLACGVKCKV